MFTVKLADINIGINNDELKDFFKDYLCDDNYEFLVCVSDDDIRYEKDKCSYIYKDIEYLKLAVYRKICEALPNYDGFLIHGSALYINDNAYLLAGVSGAGKSTHASLLRKYHNATMINDDKPLIRFINDVPYIYGTPYDGKHHLSSNISKPLKNIICINQDKENRINKLNKVDSFISLYVQTYKPNNEDSLTKTINLLNKLNDYVDTYNLYCDISKEAADLTYSIIK